MESSFKDWESGETLFEYKNSVMERCGIIPMLISPSGKIHIHKYAETKDIVYKSIHYEIAKKSYQMLNTQRILYIG